jgi:hypothetical protein
MGRAGIEPATLGLKGGLGDLVASRLCWKSVIFAVAIGSAVSVVLGGFGCHFVATLASGAWVTFWM